MIELREQLQAAEAAGSISGGVAAMNALVEAPCEPKPRSIRRLGFRPPQHRLQDMTHILNTHTYTTLDRCRDCGTFFLGSGL